jgi:hypothetical protein
MKALLMFLFLSSLACDQDPLLLEMLKETRNKTGIELPVHNDIHKELPETGFIDISLLSSLMQKCEPLSLDTKKKLKIKPCEEISLKQIPEITERLRNRYKLHIILNKPFVATPLSLPSAFSTSGKYLTCEAIKELKIIKDRLPLWVKYACFPETSPFKIKSH